MVVLYHVMDCSLSMGRLIQWAHDVDIAVLRYLNPTKENHWVVFFQFISNTTSQIAYGVPIVLLLLGLIRGNKPLLVKAALALLTVFVADYAALFIKGYLNRARPFDTITGLLHYSDAGNASFPSGHTTQAAAMAFAITLLFRKPRYAIPALLWALLVGYSRIYLGVHYPSDVAGALLLSAIVALLLLLLGKIIWPGITNASTHTNDDNSRTTTIT